MDLRKKKENYLIGSLIVAIKLFHYFLPERDSDQKYKIIEQPRLEGTSKDHLLQPLVGMGA